MGSPKKRAGGVLRGINVTELLKKGKKTAGPPDEKNIQQKNKRK